MADLSINEFNKISKYYYNLFSQYRCMPIISRILYNEMQSLHKQYNTIRHDYNEILKKIINSFGDKLYIFIKCYTALKAQYIANLDVLYVYYKNLHSYIITYDIYDTSKISEIDNPVNIAFAQFMDKIEEYALVQHIIVNPTDVDMETDPFWRYMNSTDDIIQ